MSALPPTAEMGLYIHELQALLDRVCRCLEGLGEAELNWRPPAPEANSLYAMATHILGNAEAWVLGIVSGQPVNRDRGAEFRASGSDPSGLIGRARRLSDEFAEALGALLPSALDERRQPRPPLLGIGPPDEVTVREALMRVIVHGLMHVGQMQVTRDMAVAARQTAAAHSTSDRP